MRVRKSILVQALLHSSLRFWMEFGPSRHSARNRLLSTPLTAPKAGCPLRRCLSCCRKVPTVGDESSIAQGASGPTTSPQLGKTADIFESEMVHVMHTCGRSSSMVAEKGQSCVACCHLPALALPPVFLVEHSLLPPQTPGSGNSRLRWPAKSGCLANDAGGVHLQCCCFDGLIVAC